MQGKVSALEAQLREKEQLVAALTERLEQAAEQLDRVHRTGGDRGLRLPGAGAGFPPELVEEHKSLVGELQKAVQQWEEAQATATLMRIEMQVSEIRDLVASGNFSGGANGQNGSHAPRPGSNGQKHAADDDEPQGWEALKAGLLGEPYEPPQSDRSTSEVDDAFHDNADAPAGSSDLEPIELGEAPAAVDVEAATLDELKAAVIARDDYITDLIRKLRYVESQKRLYGDLSNLDDSPEEIQNRIRELETHFDEKQRLAEVEHSLERARLSREEMRLKQLEEQLQKEVKRMGMAKAQASDEEDPDDPNGGRNSRWKRMLGINRGHE